MERPLERGLERLITVASVAVKCGTASSLAKLFPQHVPLITIRRYRPDRTRDEPKIVSHIGLVATLNTRPESFSCVFT